MNNNEEFSQNRLRKRYGSTSTRFFFTKMCFLPKIVEMATLSTGAISSLLEMRGNISFTACRASIHATRSSRVSALKWSLLVPVKMENLLSSDLLSRIVETYTHKHRDQRNKNKQNSSLTTPEKERKKTPCHPHQSFYILTNISSDKLITNFKKQSTTMMSRFYNIYDYNRNCSSICPQFLQYQGLQLNLHFNSKLFRL